MSDPTRRSPPDVQALVRHWRSRYAQELDAKLGELEAELHALLEADDFERVFANAIARLRALRGGASIYGLPIVARISEQLEECLTACASVPMEAAVLETAAAHLALMREARSLALMGAEHFLEIERRLARLRNQLVGERAAVMVVETSRVNVKLCEEVLADYPVHLTLLDDGLAALTRLLDERYRLLITGSEPKTLNGFALVAAIRLSNRPNRAIKAIVLSSQVGRNLGREIDPDYVLPRDARLPQLLRTAVETCLREPAASA